MAHYKLIVRINAGDDKFPFASIQFSKNHRPIPIDGATYSLLRISARTKASSIS